MVLELPSFVKQFESHLTWTQNFLETIQNDKGKTYMERKITKCQSFSFEDKKEEWLEVWKQYNPHNPKYVGFLARLLNNASCLTFQRNFEEALGLVNFLRELATQLTDGTHVRILPALEYSLDSLTLALKILLEDSPEDLLVGQIISKWEILQNDKSSIAVFEYFKGSLAGSLGMGENYCLEIFRKSVELDPQYSLWYHYNYQKVREVRRSLKGVENKTQVDEYLKEERKLCEMAYDLSASNNEKSLISLTDLAIVLKEQLVMTNKWDTDKQIDYEKCEQIICDGLQISEDANLQQWICKLTLLNAELLIYANPNDPEKLESGKTLLFNCLKKFPEEAMAHHKVGKLYQQESAVDVTQVWRLRKAQHHYLTALKLDPGNFGCLKDYMRLINYIPDRQYDDYRETLSILQSGIQAAETDYQIAELHILQGCFLWIYNPLSNGDNKTEACESWLYVVKNLPEYLERLMNVIANPPFKISYKKWRREPAFMNSKRIMAQLVYLRRLYSAKNDPDMTSACDTFYDKMRKCVVSRAIQLNTEWEEEDKLPATHKLSAAFQRTLSLQEADKKPRRHGNQPKFKARLDCDKSLADMDANWRSGAT